MKNLLIFLIVIGLGIKGYGQNMGPQNFDPKSKNQKQQPPQNPTPAPVPQPQPSYQDDGIHQDNSPAHTGNTYKVIRRVSSVGKGYRIQIYSGPDRLKAKETKVSFMKRFPAIRSYITYTAPYYRIRVGDFKTRGEAYDFYKHLGKTYTVMIVPSLINNRIPPKPVISDDPSETPTVEQAPEQDSTGTPITTPAPTINATQR